MQALSVQTNRNFPKKGSIFLAWGLLSYQYRIVYQWSLLVQPAEFILSGTGTSIRY